MADPSFLDWCQKHGIETHGVQPGYVAEGWRGVIAIKVLCPGTVVMSVPGNLLMSVMSAKQDPKLAAVLGQHQLSSHQVKLNCCCSCCSLPLSPAFSPSH